MLETRSILLVVTWTALIKCKMEPFVVGGKNAKISDFQHSAFLGITCFERKAYFGVSWICGSSIINEKLLLTAAHCVYGCDDRSTINVAVGHANRNKGELYTVLSYIIHDRYNPRSTSNDIGIVKIRDSLKFNAKVKRIALMASPPYQEKAQVAGWGVVNEITLETGMKLKYIDQRVWLSSSCKSIISKRPKGTICASSGNDHSYSSRGDSGSALVVRGYIQIGIVSYKIPSVSKSLVVYTDTGYFFEWIKKNAKKLYCV